MVMLMFPYIIGVLDEYIAERQRMEELNSTVADLQEELEDLTASFTEAADRLRECYRTP